MTTGMSSLLGLGLRISREMWVAKGEIVSKYKSLRLEILGVVHILGSCPRTSTPVFGYH